MKAVGRFVNKLSVRIIATVFLFVTLLSAISGYFTYRVFSKTMLNETYNFVSQIADSSMYTVTQWDFYRYYMEEGLEKFEEVALMDEEELEARKNEPAVRYFSAYADALTNLMFHAMSYDLIKLLLIVPEPEKGYNEFNAVYGQIIDYDENLAEAFMLGDVIQAESREESQIIEKIWTGETDIEYVVDYQEDKSTITVYKVVKNVNEELWGIIIISRSIQDMVDTWDRYLTGNIIVGLSLVLVFTLILWFYLRIRVLNPVKQISREADRFTREIVRREKALADDVGKITEIRFLAKSIDKMEEGTMKNIDEITQMSRESERMDTELSLAADLQMSVLPKAEKFSGQKEFDIAAEMHPAREVGGDFYDFFLLDDTHLVLIIADVSDKGVGAAFFMAVSKTMMRARVRMGGSPAEIVTFVEERLSEENEAGMFITAWLGIVDLVTGEVNACNAGHNFPAILHQETGEGYKLVKTEHGPPICFLPGMPQFDYSFSLNPGDRIFLYTDGVTDAKNVDGDRFGNERLEEALNEDREIGDASLILRVKAAVDHFAGAEPQFDDISMVSFTFLGSDGIR